MILYKYVSFTSAQKIIETSTLGFSCLEDVNDPFEGRALKFKRNKKTSKTPDSVIVRAVRNRLSRNYGILSLTRQPLNPLMWAHYGESHTGVVIGINVKKAKLTCEKTSVIPAQYGEIVYTQTKPYSSLSEPTTDQLMKIGEEVQSFNSHEFQLFKQAFLYKSIEWGYEEEVRVVKNISSNISRYRNGEFSNKSGNWKQLIIEGRPLFCLQIPENSITEVYLGTSVNKNVSRKGITNNEYVETIEKWENKNIKVYNCRPKVDSWDLEPFTHKIIK